MLKIITLLALAAVAAGACAPLPAPPAPTAGLGTATPVIPSTGNQPTTTTAAGPTPTFPPGSLGPNLENFPLGEGNSGTAYLFRDGQKFPIMWTTAAGDYENQAGLRRPIRFTDQAGNPVPLKPGNTWVHVMSSPSTVTEQSPGNWLAQFVIPAGPH